MDPSLDHHEYCTGGFSPDDVVISGVAGRFPLCDNIGELKEALLAKKTLLVPSDERYEEGAAGCPQRIRGIINNIDKFDAYFFGVPNNLAKSMDPAMRKVIEVSYEAIADSGYDPHSLKGLNIGVYNAISNDDAARLEIADPKNFAVGYLRCMNANRFSFICDFHGPSLTVDTACSSSAVALCIAYHDIIEGRVDAAIISACQLCLSPVQNNNYIQSGIISETGVSAPFDASASGMVRSEAAGSLFLQKASVARRVYSTLISIKHMAAGYVPEGVYVPSFKQEVTLFIDTLKDAGISNQDVDFIEAHGTGTSVGDPIELNAIAEVFCKGRKKPLFIGSVKSNLGHSEAVSGICGIIKSIVAFEAEVILPNYNFKTPNPKCSALLKGDLSIVTEPLPFSKNIIPVNSFGFGGSIVSLILRKNPIEYSKYQTSGTVPQLILHPATTEGAVNLVFEYIKNTPDLQREFFTLLNKLAFTPTLLKPFRGYALFPDFGDPVFQIKNSLSDKRQVWFIMTGMGCQWPGMGLQLMEIDIFAQSMKKSAEVLKTVGINLFEILRKDKNSLQVHRSITPAFVSITAIQIALIDLLKAIEIYPDGIIGHSTGELVCAYVDGCCSAEQTILSAYWRGVAVENANLPYCEMAAIGMSWEDAKHKCPKSVYAACHNADDSVTISGLKEPLEKFVDQLKKENIFARTVNSYGYGFHSKFIHPAADNLRGALSKIFPKPKPRSKRWISSSFLENEWETEGCRIAGAEYFVHNLISVVHFNEAAKKIPPDAIIIEIGPHFLLQSILKRIIGSKASYFGLMKRNEENNVNYIFESFGKLYIEGLNPNIEKLYPPVKFPVPRTTPMISDILRWDYSQTWFVPKWSPTSTSFTHTFYLDGADSYLLDHCIQGRSLFPATGYIYLAWLALAKKVKKVFSDVPVVIENFKIHKATILGHSEKLSFSVTILNMSGDFEITERSSLVASGKIIHSQSISFGDPQPVYVHDDSSIAIPGEDVYNELRISGYQYGPFFQGLVEINLDGTCGLVSWNDKWITFMDSLLLFFGLIENNKTFLLPTGAHSIKICPNILKEDFVNYKNKKLLGLPVSFNPYMNRCRCSGIEITKLILDPAPQSLQCDTPMLEEYKFVPYVSCCNLSDISDKYLSYMSACNDMIEKIGKNLKTDVEYAKFPINKYSGDDFKVDMKEISVNHKLLSILKEVAELGSISNVMKQSKELFLSYLKNIGKDILNSILANERYMRIMLDIISENSYRKLNVLEINKDFPVLLPYVTKIIEKYSHLKFKSKILVSNARNLDSDMIEENKIKIQSCDKLASLSKEKSQNVVISSFFWGTCEELKDHIYLLSSVLDKDSFILFFHKREVFAPEVFLSALCHETIPIISDSVLEEILLSENLTVVSKISDYLGGSLYLLHNSVPITSCKILYITESEYSWVEELKSSLYNNSSGIVWIISKDNALSGIIGMVNCLRYEPGGERIRCIFMADGNNNYELPNFNPEDPFYMGIMKRNMLMNVFKNNTWGSFRHIMLESGKEMQELENSFVVCNRFGDLSSFHWMESAVKYQKFPEDDIIHVYYSALNFKDVMIATGKLPVAQDKDLLNETSLLGFEFSGRNSSGQRIAGLCTRAISNMTVKHPSLYFEVPDHWTLEEAATVPVVYATCFYALLIRGNLLPGESILIHSGTGGIGLAAINIALSLHCEIFITVGNEQKRNYLRKLFPQIKSENIGCSRNTSFEDLIMSNTKGKGVNIVLNSLAEDKFQASLRCVAKHGRFLEIGKYDLAMDHSLGLKLFLKNITFHSIFLDEVEKSSILKHIMQLLKDGIKSGVVKPLDRTVFHRDETEKAFRYMASGVHIGKILLKIRDEEPKKYAVPKMLKLPSIPFTYFYDHKVYIIIGGLGGFGIELTKWLLGKGARNIILTSRYGARTPYHHLCLKRWEKRGFNVSVSTLNVAIIDEAKELIKLASHIGPIGGIFNSAVVLKDSFLESMNAKNFKEVCDPKAVATQNLDELTQSLCSDLDYFVCFSSISCGRGNAGQTNYGYANSVMERICEQRRSAGLHGLAIQWGIIGEVGVVHRHMGDDAMIAGVCAQNVMSCLDTLELFCQKKHPVVSSYMISNLTPKKGKQVDVLDQIAKMFGLNDVSDFNTYRSFVEMGLDSIIGIEMKHLLDSTFDQTFTIKEIQEMKIDDLKRLLEESEDIQKLNQNSSGLVSTTNINLPEPIEYVNPLISLNAAISGTPIFIVNIGDGDLSHIRTLAESIDKPVFALVWTKDSLIGNIETIAAWYLEKIKNKTTHPFHLIGFSTGGNLAFEMMLQSEKSGCNIKTFCLFGSSTFLSKAVNQEFDDKNLEVNILCEYIEQYIPGNTNKIQKELLRVKTLDERIRIIVNALANVCTEAVNKNKLSDTINLYVKKITLLQTYTPEIKLARDISILEDSTELLANDVSEVKCVLAKICSGKINIFRLPDIKEISEESVPRIISVLNNIFLENN